MFTDSCVTLDCITYMCRFRFWCLTFFSFFFGGNSVDWKVSKLKVFCRLERFQNWKWRRFLLLCLLLLLTVPTLLSISVFLLRCLNPVRTVKISLSKFAATWHADSFWSILISSRYEEYPFFSFFSVIDIVCIQTKLFGQCLEVVNFIFYATHLVSLG